MGIELLTVIFVYIYRKILFEDNACIKHTNYIIEWICCHTHTHRGHTPNFTVTVCFPSLEAVSVVKYRHINIELIRFLCHDCCARNTYRKIGLLVEPGQPRTYGYSRRISIYLYTVIQEKIFNKLRLSRGPRFWAWMPACYAFWHPNQTATPVPVGLVNHVHWPLTRYVKLRVAHAPGMPGTFSLQSRVSNPDMHHGTCITHVPWCMPGSLTGGFLWSRWWGKRSRHAQRMLNLQFYVSGKRSMGS